MTDNDRVVYRTVVTWKIEHDGCAPSRDAIARETGLAKSSIHVALTNLKRAGYIRIFPGACQIQLPNSEYTFYGKRDVE